MDEIELRPATEADNDFLFDLHRQTFRSYVEQTWVWDENTQSEMFRQELANAPFEIVQYRGEEIGCIYVEDQGDALFLDYIAILPAYQGRGIGTRLVRNVLVEGARRRVPVKLNVLRVNPARALYERLGFRITGGDEYRHFMEARPDRPRER